MHSFYEKRRSEESEEMSFNEDYEEKFVKENFHNFNFPTEKEGSFVVKVENEHAESWDKCFQNLYGEAKVNTNAKTGKSPMRGLSSQFTSIKNQKLQK